MNSSFMKVLNRTIEGVLPDHTHMVIEDIKERAVCEDGGVYHVRVGYDIGSTHHRATYRVCAYEDRTMNASLIPTQQ